MNINDIKKLVEIISANDLIDFELKENDFSIRIRRGGEVVTPAFQSSYQPSGNQVSAPNVSDAPMAGSQKEASSGSADAGLEFIKSPMVGTFYKAASPESKPYVTEGDKVGMDTVVCIIEAMKVMNEIVAEQTGVVVEILVADGDPVEYGQPLFKVKRA